MRVFASVFFFRLIGRLTGLSKSIISSMSRLGGILVLIGLLFGFFQYERYQIPLLLFTNLLSVYVSIQFYRSPKSPINKLLFVSSTLSALGYILDTINLCLESVPYNLPFPYFDRYLTFPFLFLSVFFVAYQLYENATASMKMAIIEEIAAQANHDIQSPIAALSVVVQSTPDIEKDTRELIINATQRIQSITANLKDFLKDQEESKVILLQKELAFLLEEKKFQFKTKPNASIRFESTATDEMFVKVQLGEFQRLISNLINNSFEAYSGDQEAIVHLKVSTQNKRAQIEIKDFGKGIPEGDLRQLGKRGVSFGKATGSGLGIYHAKKSIEKWGGSFFISSQINQGTTVTLTLPLEDLS